MKILVVGCGSIGTRRARILARMGHEVHGCDPMWANATGFDWVKKVGAAAVWDDIETAGAAFEDWGAVLICTPPDSGRLAQIGAAMDMAINVFVEKPLALTEREVVMISGLPTDGLVTMGACNLRFACKLQQKIEVLEMPWQSMKFEMRQHSKHWNKRHKPISLILDSIHELDLAVAFQGPITGITGASTLDHCLARVAHEGGGASVIEMDRVTTPPERFVTVTDAQGVAHREEVNTYGMYERELAHFIECAAEGRDTCNDLSAAAATCLWALKVVA